MATATKQIVKTPVITTTYESTETVTLVLSVAEAETLRVVMGLISGNILTSRRRHADSIRQALSSAGIAWLVKSKYSSDISHPRAANYDGHIRFNSESF